MSFGGNHLEFKKKKPKTLVKPKLNLNGTRFCVKFIQVELTKISYLWVY